MGVSLSTELITRALAGASVFPAVPPRRGAFAPAAVVVPLRLAGHDTVIVVVRSTELADHAGELGFPGGKPLPGEALSSAAYRELGEELAVTSDELEPLGELTPIPVVTGKYLITPFVAALATSAAPRIASSELSALLEVPLRPYLAGERKIFGFMTDWRGTPFALPHFRLDDRVLFGASAVILYELIARLARELGVRLPELEIEADRPWGNRYPA